MMPSKPTIEGFETNEIRPRLFSIEVVKDGDENENNCEWKRLANSLVNYLKETEKHVVLISTLTLPTLIDGGDTASEFTEFKYEGKRYYVTKLDEDHLSLQLPQIMSSEEFVFGLNVWLCLFNDPIDVNELCAGVFLSEMKKVISNLDKIALFDLDIELLAAVSDGIDLYWWK